MAASRAKNAKSGAARAKRGPLFRAMMENLPFKLTDSQQKVIDEIIDGASAGAQSARLLQGDVGSGKTAVAATFAAAICDGGAQCAVLAPTEALAEQLCAQMKKYIPLAEGECLLIKGSMPAAARRGAEASAADGSARIIAGTQALLSEKLKFHKLGAVIIDEQQRFGVRQREKLLGGGARPHLLMLSATPIPRTTALTFYGDLDLSVIDSVPTGRTPVETRLADYAKLPEAAALRRARNSRGRPRLLDMPARRGGRRRGRLRRQTLRMACEKTAARKNFARPRTARKRRKKSARWRTSAAARRSCSSARRCSRSA